MDIFKFNITNTTNQNKTLNFVEHTKFNVLFYLWDIFLLVENSRGSKDRKLKKENMERYGENGKLFA